MNWFSQMTEGPWWVDISAIAGVVVAVGIILRMVIWPGLKAIWRAIIAAPQIAQGVGRLVELLETDLLGRVERVEIQIIDFEKHIIIYDAYMSGEKARIDAHDKRADANELRLSILEELYKRLTTVT